MSYLAVIYHVFLASPSDVAEERKKAREIILDWNNIHGFSKKIFLTPVGWETNAVPTMGDRPQEIINKQILDSSDLLVGIFWTRVGTATGTAISGTVEEIEKHIDAGKPAMLYFSNKPVIPDTIDMSQYDAVRNLKKEYQSRGLTETFDSLEDFGNKFQRHLSIKINADNYFKSYNTKVNGSFSSNFLDAKTEIVSELSEQTKLLLIEAASDPNGQIIKMKYSGGFTVQTNNRSFMKENSTREAAEWESVFAQLENRALIKSVGAKGQVFKLTSEGYKIVDDLRAEKG